MAFGCPLLRLNRRRSPLKASAVLGKSRRFSPKIMNAVETTSPSSSKGWGPQGRKGFSANQLTESSRKSGSTPPLASDDLPHQATPAQASGPLLGGAGLSAAPEPTHIPDPCRKTTAQRVLLLEAGDEPPSQLLIPGLGIFIEVDRPGLLEQPGQSTRPDRNRQESLPGSLAIATSVRHHSEALKFSLQWATTARMRRNFW